MHRTRQPMGRKRSLSVLRSAAAGAGLATLAVGSFASSASAALTPTRYAITGGNGTWASTTNWSLSSGGASGASVPSGTHTAYFGGVTLTLGAATNQAPSIEWHNGAVLNVGTAGGYNYFYGATTNTWEFNDSVTVNSGGLLTGTHAFGAGNLWIGSGTIHKTGVGYIDPVHDSNAFAGTISVDEGSVRLTGSNAQSVVAHWHLAGGTSLRTYAQARTFTDTVITGGDTTSTTSISQDATNYSITMGSGGKLSPGNINSSVSSAATFSISTSGNGKFTFGADSEYIADITGATSAEADSLAISYTSTSKPVINSAAKLSVRLFSPSDPGSTTIATTQWNIITATDIAAGDFASSLVTFTDSSGGVYNATTNPNSLVGRPDGKGWQNVAVGYDRNTTGTDRVYVTANFVPIPEPTSAAGLVAAGVIGALRRRRISRRKHDAVFVAHSSHR